jgi:hypothetical protein
MKPGIPAKATVVAAVLLPLLGCTSNPGYVKVANPGVEVTVGTGWIGGTTVTQERGAVALAPGTYYPRSIRLIAEESTSQPSARKGATWTLSSIGSFDKLAYIRVEQGKTAVLEAGPPLVVRAYTYQRGVTVSISVEVAGRAGEAYALAASRNGVPQPLPRLKIVAESGKVLDSGTLAYG